MQALKCISQMYLNYFQRGYNTYGAVCPEIEQEFHFISNFGHWIFKDSNIA